MIAGNNSLTYGLTKHLTKLIGKTKQHIKNFKALVNMLKNVKVEEGEVLTSFDVLVLFTSILTKEVMKMCVDQVKKDPTWVTRSGFTLEEFGDLLELTLDRTYF